MKEIFKLLKQDHASAKDLFKQIESTDESDLKRRLSLFNKLKDELSLHERAEEDIVYSRCQENDVTRSLALEGYEEHEVANQLMEKLEALPTADERWLAVLKVLKENVEHHIQEEENELFPKIKKAFDDEILDELASSFQNEKAEIQDEDLGTESAYAVEATPPLH